MQVQVKHFVEKFQAVSAWLSRCPVRDHVLWSFRMPDTCLAPTPDAWRYFPEEGSGMKRINSNRFPGGIIVLAVTCAFVVAFTKPSPAAEKPKRVLRNNMTEVYKILPSTASTFYEAFTKGLFYGRLRVNSFYWSNQDGDKYDPAGFGLGGSLIFKSAPLYGISGTVGLYTSQNLGMLDEDDALYGRSGKDTFSRYDRLRDGDWGMTVLAQAYLQYHISKSDIKIGRQIFESFLTKSNDTKMIPNTFEGYTLESKDLPHTTFKFGYLTKQKLRDHTRFHDVITYGDKNAYVHDGKNISNWNNNDDSAVHKGLSYANLKAAGENVENDLVIAGLTHRALDNLKLDLWYTSVPDLFYSLMAESNYRVALGDGWSLTPGLRFMQQFDTGAGDIGGAALNGSLAGVSGSANGYDNADSVSAKLYAARLVLRKGAGRLQAGYSRVSDDADIIAPWRGFPTAGYTRAMGQYNWEANTKTWMVQAFYDFGKAGIIPGFRMCFDYSYINYDDDKERLGGLSKTDQNYYHVDIWYIFPFLPALEAKFRAGHADAQKTVSGSNPSYSEYRFEMNYLF